VGATRTLQHGTDADYLELEARLMAFVDDVRSQSTASEPLPRLRQLAAAHVRWRLRNPELAEVFDILVGMRTRVASLPAEHRARIRAIKRMYLDELRGVLNAGARSGTFDFADVRVTAFAIVTLCGSANTWFDPEGDLTVDEVAAMYADFVAGMVRAPMRVD
jgi:hypothetical protein